MDEKLEKALAHAKYRQTVQNQIHQLKVTTNNALIMSVNGGTFTVDRTLMSFVYMLVQENMEETVLLDDNDLPIVITDIPKLHDDLLDLYYSVLNEYSESYNELKKARSVSKLLDVKV